jgi:hypothetical protein
MLQKQKGNSKMKLLNKSSMQRASNVLVAAAAPLAILGCMAAMNGGTALGTGPFDVIVTTLRDLLQSSWTLALGFVLLVVCVWQLAHGGGYKYIGFILGLFAVALVGPGFLTTISTSMPNAAQMQLIKQAPATAPAVPRVLAAK